MAMQAHQGGLLEQLHMMFQAKEQMISMLICSAHSKVSYLFIQHWELIMIRGNCCILEGEIVKPIAERYFSKMEQGSLRSSILGMTCAAIGSGVLTFP